MSPSKFREKTRKEAHTKRFSSVQKLQAITVIVRLKLILKSCFSHALLNTSHAQASMVNAPSNL